MLQHLKVLLYSTRKTSTKMHMKNSTENYERIDDDAMVYVHANFGVE
jgi:hypothetical protein